jgi:hypothetical protein
MDAFNTALETQKEDTLDITADMLRQYKAMQEQLLRKIAELEADNRSLKVYLLVERPAFTDIACSNSWVNKSMSLAECCQHLAMALQGTVEEKDSEIRRLQGEKEALKKACDVEVGRGGGGGAGGGQGLTSTSGWVDGCHIRAVGWTRQAG